MEQALTDEQLISLLDVLEEGDKSFTQASYRDVIMTAHTDMLFELGIRNVAAMEAGWKAFGNLQTKFHGEILSVYGKFQAGTLSTAAATTKFQNLLRTYGKDAFMAGTEMVGNSYYKTVGMTKKDAAFINKYARTETRHWRKFLRDIKDPKHLPTHKIPRDASGRLLKGYRRQVHPYRQRVGYYADSLRGMGFNGMVAGAGTLLNIFWVLDKLVGRRTDHCDDCVRIAAGNPYSWQTLPTTPKAGDTECKYRCYCGLEFQQRKGRGKQFDIPGSGSAQGLQAPNRWARIFDRFGRPISGAPLQDIEDIYQQMNKARQMIEITKAQEKLGWIRTRQQLNNALINQYPQYRKIPLVSVKDLTKAVTAAQPARGDLLKSLANVASGTEVTFLRGNYFANGKLFLERGQWVFKDATGVRLAANLETDIVFSLQPKWRPSGTLTQAQRWAKNSTYQGDLWHGTGISSATAITKGGFRITEKSSGLIGTGVYLTRDLAYAKAYSKWRGGVGGAELQLKINVRNTLTDIDLFSKIQKKWAKKLRIDFMDAPEIMIKVTEELVAMGYDSVHIGLGGAIDEWCIFNPNNVMVVTK